MYGTNAVFFEQYLQIPGLASGAMHTSYLNSCKMSEVGLVMKLTYWLYRNIYLPEFVASRELINKIKTRLNDRDINNDFSKFFDIVICNEENLNDFIAPKCGIRLTVEKIVTNLKPNDKNEIELDLLGFNYYSGVINGIDVEVPVLAEERRKKSIVHNKFHIKLDH